MVSPRSGVAELKDSKNELLFRFLLGKRRSVSRTGGRYICHDIQKENPEDCANYRCIGLLNQGYKIMSVILLQRLLKECEGLLL